MRFFLVSLFCCGTHLASFAQTLSTALLNRRAGVAKMVSTAQPLDALCITGAPKGSSISVSDGHGKVYFSAAARP